MLWMKQLEKLSEMETEIKKPKWPMNEAYTIQMTAMMVMANMYNSSPGRHASQTAHTAMDAALALVEEMKKRGDKYGIYF